MVGIKIGDYHTWKDWGLYLQEINIEMPTRKDHVISVPGMDGVIDLSDVLTNGEPRYKNRPLIFSFEFQDGSYEKMMTVVSDIANKINGKRLKIILDEDPQYFYMGVVHVMADKVNSMVSSFDISVDADPYKYDVLSSTDDWLWDSFNFDTGIILVLKNVQINNNTVVIPGREAVGTIPIINVTNVISPMVVMCDNKTYILKQGRNRFPQIRVNNGEVELKFTGKGTVNIEYRRRSQ